MLVQELFRDTFVAVCKPALLPGGRPLRDLVGLAQLTLIHWYWSPQEMHPPTWRWWLQHVQDQYTSVPNIDELRQVTFREELHAIEAVINGQGIALFSDHLILNELQSGVLIKAMEPSLPGLSCYIVSQPDHPRKNIIEMFSSWLCSFV